jgi:hypothetical protein
VNIHYDQVKNEDIIYFWENFIFTSIYSSQKTSKKTPKYQNYLANNNVLSTFQVDLITYSNTKDKVVFYALICIDEVSKFIFSSFLRNKQKNSVKNAFSSIIKKIRDIKNRKQLYNISQDLTFYADAGEEFKFKNVIEYCEKNNAKIINIGTPGVTKLGIVERAIRTLQEMLAISINDISNKFQYKKELKKVIKMYNRQTHSFLKMSPSKFLEEINMNLKPWNISQQSNNNFDYFKNRKEIKKKLKQVKKEFPIMQKVRLHKKNKKQNKRSHMSTWSNEIYVVKGYKIPLLSYSDVGIYLTDMNGKQIKGITYRENLKKVKKSDYIQIKKIIAYMKRKKSVRCSFDNYPNSYYKDILLSDLNKYSIPKRIRQEINNWRKKNDI